MGIIKEVLNNQIDTKNTQSYKSTTGVILKYNSVTNTAKVKFKNPNGDGYLIMEQIPVSLSNPTSGFTGIQESKECNISFINNNIFSPVITGVYDNYYSQKTMDDNGAFIVNPGILSIKEPEEITPMINNWIDNNNNDLDKYNNDLSEHIINRDIDKYAYDITRNITYFKDNDQGLINIVNKSGIKIKDNGDIDIFIDNNSGIKISKQERSIRIYGLKIIEDK